MSVYWQVKFKKKKKKQNYAKFSWFVSECGLLASYETQENTHLIETGVSGADHRLIFRSGKPHCLVSQPSLLLSHATWKEARSCDPSQRF